VRASSQPAHVGVQKNAPGRRRQTPRHRTSAAGPWTSVRNLRVEWILSRPLIAKMPAAKTHKKKVRAQIQMSAKPLEKNPLSL
jgi:hypothetical protein